MNGKISANLARELLTYNPNTGLLKWKARGLRFFENESQMKSWNSRFAGKYAFTCENGNGYMHGTIFGKNYLAHRVAWLIYTGSWPENLIDHINRIKTDNRIANLRDVTDSENKRNMPISRRNKSGYSGVSVNSVNGSRWDARITVDQKRVYIGTYDTIEDAVLAKREREDLIKAANHSD